MVFTLWANCDSAMVCHNKFASELELLSEIHFSNVLIFQNILRRACRDQNSVTQYISVTADAERFSDIMVSDQDPDIALTQMPDDTLDIQHRDWIDARKGFVEQDEQGIGCQCPRYFNTATFTARQADAEVAANMSDV